MQVNRLLGAAALAAALLPWCSSARADDDNSTKKPDAAEKVPPSEATTQSTIDVLVPGGTANGIRQTYPGAPQLVPGQQYVLFLWTSRQGVTYTIGFTQGVFNLLQDGSGNITAAQMPTTETILAPGTGQVVKNQPISMPLAQLISAITAGGTTQP